MTSVNPDQQGCYCAGDERPGSVPADIVFIIEERPHPVFQREGNDLVYTAKLPLVDALCGATIRLTTLDDRQLTVRGTPDFHPYTLFRILSGDGAQQGSRHCLHSSMQQVAA